MAADGVPVVDAGLGTEERILVVAERMFAMHGIDHVSIRSITKAAGANTAAVHYYFSSKDALVQAIIHRRMAAVWEARSKLFADMEAAPERVTARDLVEVMLYPNADYAFVPGHEARYYPGFLRQVMSHPGASQRWVSEEFGPQRRHLQPLLQRALPDLPPPLLHFRFMLVIDCLTNHLADLGWSMRPWAELGAAPSREVFLESLVDALTGILTAPVTSRRDPPKAPGRSRRAGA